MKVLLTLMSILILSGCATLVTPPPAQQPLAGPTSSAPAPTGEVSPLPTLATSESASPLPTPVPTNMVSPVATPGQPDERALIAVAQSDLATRLNVSADQIQFVRYEQVDWPDTSAGCPQPGKMYAQVISPGYQIVFTANGRQYEYHGLGNDTPFLCEK